MGNGLQPIGSSGPRVTGPVNQENIQETSKVGEAQPKQVNGDMQSSQQGNTKPSVSNPSGRKLEQSFNGAARRAELEGHFDRVDVERGESMKAARKILDNPKLSNEARVAELQKMLGKTDKLEFQQFMKQIGNFSPSQREVVNSAISESPKIMERVAVELPPGMQLDVVSNAILHPLRGKSEGEERKRMERADKGFSEWMQRTDVNTLNVALEGRAVDFRASAKLFGVMASDPSLLIRSMDQNHSRLLGDNQTIAIELMNIVHGPASLKYAPMSRSDIESTAGALIQQHAQLEMDRRRGRAL